MAPVKKPVSTKTMSVKDNATRIVSEVTTRLDLPSSFARKNTPDARLSKISARLIRMRILNTGNTRRHSVDYGPV